MAQLPILTHKLVHKPGAGGHDGYQWRVHLEEDGAGVDYLVVELSATQAVVTGLAAAEIDSRLEAAVQRYASNRLDNYVPVLDQVGQWDAPIVLHAEHFAD